MLLKTDFRIGNIWLLVAFAGSAVQGQSINLEVGYDKSQVYQVELLIEHAGMVVVEYNDKEKQDQQFTIDVKARLKYHERFIGSSVKPQSVRFYDESKAVMQIDKATLNSELAKENRLIVSRIKTDSGNKYQFASVNDVLQQKELELIKNPGDPLSLAGILNQNSVEVGSPWEPERDALARLLAVDRVIYSDVKLSLKEADKQSAKLHLIGKVKAEVDDTLTEMALAGVVQLDRTHRIVRAMRLTVNENRRAAQIAPGFQGQTKIDLKIAPVDEIPELSTESLREIAKTKTIRNVLKWVVESGSFELKYDPNWKLITSDNDAAILRFVEDGDLLTQCSVVRLASRPVDKPLSLSDFQTEVTKIISRDPNSRVDHAEQGVTVNGLKTLKVLVSGIEEEVRMNWLYYNVASTDGRQVTFVFMLEEQVLGRVSSAAQRLVDGFAFNILAEKQNLDIKDAAVERERDAKAVEGSVR